MQLPLKEFQIVLRHGIRVMQADSFEGELPTGRALAGPQTRSGGRTQSRCQAVAGLLARRASQISDTPKDRRGLRVGASALELHTHEPERLDLVPFRQSSSGCLATLSCETVEQIDGHVVTAVFCGLECFSNSVDEPEMIQFVVFAGSTASFRGTGIFAH